MQELGSKGAEEPSQGPIAKAQVHVPDCIAMMPQHVACFSSSPSILTNAAQQTDLQIIATHCLLFSDCAYLI